MIFVMLTSSMKNLGMIEIVPHQKIGPQLLCGRMDKVMNNFFNNLKVVLFLVLKANFYVIFGFPSQKSTKVKIFMKVGLIELKL